MTNLSQLGYTHDQILSLLFSRDGIIRRTYRLYTIRNGWPYKRLNAHKIHIECNEEDSVKYGGAFSFERTGWIDWNNDRIQPFMALKHDDAEFQFPLSPPMRVVSDHDDTYLFYRNKTAHVMLSTSVESYDESSFLRNNNLGDVLYYEQGTPYLSIFADLFRLADVTNYMIVPTDKTLLTQRQFELGEEILEIINTLLEEINYVTLRAEKNGTLTSMPYVPPSEAKPQIQYYGARRNIIRSSIKRTSDRFDKFNVFVGYYINPDTGEQWREEVRNELPSSILSIPSVGHRITAPPVQYDNVPDEETLYDLTYKQMEDNNLAYEWNEFDSIVMPQHEVGDFITIDNPALQGSFKGTYWSIDVSQQDNGGFEQTMKHKLRSLYSA